MLAAVATRGLRDGPLEAGLAAAARPRGPFSVRGGARERGEADGESGDSGCRWPTLRQGRLVSRLSDAATVRGPGVTHHAMGYARRGSAGAGPRPEAAWAWVVGCGLNSVVWKRWRWSVAGRAFRAHPKRRRASSRTGSHRDGSRGGGAEGLGSRRSRTPLPPLAPSNAVPRLPPSGGSRQAADMSVWGSERGERPTWCRSWRVCNYCTAGPSGAAHGGGVGGGAAVPPLRPRSRRQFLR